MKRDGDGFLKMALKPSALRAEGRSGRPKEWLALRPRGREDISGSRNRGQTGVAGVQHINSP